MSDPYNVPTQQQALNNPFSAFPQLLTSAMLKTGGNAFSRLLSGPTRPGVLTDNTWGGFDPVDPNSVRDQPNPSQGGYSIDDQLNGLLQPRPSYTDPVQGLPLPAAGAPPSPAQGAPASPGFNSLVQTLTRNRLAAARGGQDPNSLTPGSNTGTNAVF